MSTSPTALTPADELATRKETIDKLIQKNDWLKLHDKFGKTKDMDMRNQLMHYIHQRLEETGKLIEYIEYIKEYALDILPYIIRSGDLYAFKTLYESSTGYFHMVDYINRIGQSADNTIIIDYINSTLDFLTPKQKEICRNGKLVLSVQTRQTISIPFQKLLDPGNPTQLLTNGIKLYSPGIETFEIETDNLGRGMMNFVENYDPAKLDMNFFQQNHEFLMTLTAREVAILSGYTHQGDRLVNIILRKDSDIKEYIDSIWPLSVKLTLENLIPIYYQLLDKVAIDKTVNAVHDWIKSQPRDDSFYRIIEECIETYVFELKNIFRKAPKIKTEMCVFRGSKTFYYGTEKSDVFINGDFMSASLSPYVPLKFVEGDCCFTQMRLKPGMKAIFMEPISQYTGEFEILISPGNRFKMLKNKIKKLISIPDAYERGVNYKKFSCADIDRKDIRFTLMIGGA